MTRTSISAFNLLAADEDIGQMLSKAKHLPLKNPLHKISRSNSFKSKKLPLTNFTTAKSIFFSNRNGYVRKQPSSKYEPNFVSRSEKNFQIENNENLELSKIEKKKTASKIIYNIPIERANCNSTSTNYPKLSIQFTDNLEKLKYRQRIHLNNLLGTPSKDLTCV